MIKLREKIMLSCVALFIILIIIVLFFTFYSPYNFHGGIRSFECELIGFDIDSSCGSPIWCETNVYCKNCSDGWYFQNGEEALESIFEVNKTYVIYWTEMEYESCSTAGNYYWADVIIRVDDEYGNCLWKSWRYDKI